jgi:hypothetical protein
MHIIGRTADQVFGHVEMDATPFAKPPDKLGHLGHDFGADAVARQDKKGRIGQDAPPVG